MVNRQAKVLCGAPVNVDAETFRARTQLLQEQELWPGTSLDFHHVIDTDDPETLEVARDVGSVEVLPQEPQKGSWYDSSRGTHAWNQSRLDRVAEAKQRLFDMAVERGYTHFLLCDSDLLCDSRTLKSLLASRTPVTSAVFWTQWNAGDPSSWGPNVWLRQPYGQEGMGMQGNEFYYNLVKRRLVPVLGGGALCLYDTEALKKGVQCFPRMEHFPEEGMWQGEDRTVAEWCRRLHVMQAADPWPNVFHLYHPEQREPGYVEGAVEALSAPSQTRAGYGDLVHFLVEPLEQNAPNVSVRGRVGELELAPSLENFLLTTEVGAKEVMEIKLPFYWPRNPGGTYIAQVEFLDCRPYGFPPGIANEILEEFTHE